VVKITVYLATALGLASSALCLGEGQRYKTGQIKVGDRVLADSIGLGKPDTCTVIGTTELTGAYMPGYTNQYLIRCDKEAWSSVPATADKVKLAGQANVLNSGAAAAAQPAAGANKYALAIRILVSIQKLLPGQTLIAPTRASTSYAKPKEWRATIFIW
jgi:hypothetical protein